LLASQGYLEEQLRRLQDEKLKIELRLQGINEQIDDVASKLEAVLSPELAKFLRDLSSDAEKLALGYVRKMLRHYGDLDQELQQMPDKLSYLCLEVQTWLEDLYDAMRTKKIAFLESDDYTLYLIDARCKNASIANYEFLFNLIGEDLVKKIAFQEDKENFLECVNFLKEEAFRLY
jgi:hypothetical protein